MENKFDILVVDDDLKNIQVGINFLKQKENYYMVFATSGQQALERVKELDFDLILLDIIMPGMDGFEVCIKLKSEEKTKNIPIIFLTAKDDTESLIKGFEIGGADYITKPFNSHELHARVKTHLELNYHCRNEIKKLKELLVYSQEVEMIKFIVGGIAHDCNNMLCTIPTNLLLIQDKIEKSGGEVCLFEDFSNGINLAVSKASDLLTQLLDISKNVSDIHEAVDMNEVVSDLGKIYKGSIGRNIVFETIFLSQPALTYANKLHVEQVLLNIIINAQHAISESSDKNIEGKIKLVIDKVTGADLPLDASLNYLKVSIKDNGTGIKKEILSKIFEPYFTSRKELGGTGLGLAISHHVVQSYNGCITVSSVEGEGSCFNVYLPFYDEQN